MEKLKNRKITLIDMAVDKGTESKPSTDPTKYHSLKSGRGPLAPGWKNVVRPIMCCYKLATINVKASLLTSTLESSVEKVLFVCGHTFFNIFSICSNNSILY